MKTNLLNHLPNHDLDTLYKKCIGYEPIICKEMSRAETIEALREILITVIGDRFAELMRTTLTPSQLQIVNGMNILTNFNNDCYSCKFTDSNTLAEQSYKEFIQKDFDINDDDALTLLGDAWNLAMRNKFQPLI